MTVTTETPQSRRADPAPRATKGMPVPHDLEAEESLLGSCMLSRDAIAISEARAISTADFYKPSHGMIYDGILTLVAEGKPCDPVTLTEALTRLGTIAKVGGQAGLMAIQARTPASANANAYASIVIDKSSRRRLIEAAGRIAEVGYDLNVATVEALRLAQEWIENAEMQFGGGPDQKVTEFVDTRAPERWVLPGLLQPQERLLLVAPEKYGKSTMLRQIAIRASAGLMPFTNKRLPRSLRCLIIDLENPPELIRKKLTPMLKLVLDLYLGQDARDIYQDENLRIVTRQEGLDLSNRHDFLWLMDRVAANATAMGGLDLVCIGPIYKMDFEADEKASGARRVQHALDVMRHRFDCALIMETHAPHSSFDSRGPERQLRPAGSRMWLRWPEFCRGIEPTDGHPGHGLFYDCEGARDERSWPTLLRRHGSWPWMSPEAGELT